MTLASWLRRLPIPRGAGLFVSLMALALFGRLSGYYDLYGYLGLDPSAVWRGEVWRIFTYALLPAGPVDLLLGGWALIWLGSWLERLWTPLECWLYAGACTAVAGTAACLFFPGFQGLLGGGTAVAVAGLLVAWGRLSGHERVPLAQGLETTVRTAALIWGASLLLIAWFSCGRWFALPLLLASAGAGWLYLSFRWRLIRRQAFRPVPQERMSRLEL